MSSVRALNACGVGSDRPNMAKKLLLGVVATILGLKSVGVGRMIFLLVGNFYNCNKMIFLLV
jgi:hypothetical protein